MMVVQIGIFITKFGLKCRFQTYQTVNQPDQVLALKGSSNCTTGSQLDDARVNQFKNKKKAIVTHIDATL